MKGLLLKDFYMAVKYCRAYLLIAVVFIAVSFAGDDNLFFIFYPCLLCGMIPVNLLAYDERSKWLQYSATLPYSRAQIVSTKYLVGMIAQTLMILATGAARMVQMYRNGTFALGDFVVLCLLLLILSTVTSSISLPFMFKWGVEKGRIAYFVMIGVVCGGSVAAASVFRGVLQAQIQPEGILPVLALGGIGLYALSWYLSIRFYEKRDL